MESWWLVNGDVDGVLCQQMFKEVVWHGNAQIVLERPAHGETNMLSSMQLLSESEAMEARLLGCGGQCT